MASSTEWRRLHPERAREHGRAYINRLTPEQRARRLARITAWKKANRDRVRVAEQASYQRNRDKRLAYGRRHRVDAAEYHASYRQINRYAIKARQRAWYELNRERLMARVRVWVEANPEKRRAHSLAYAQRNPVALRVNRAKRRAVELSAMPPWADASAIVAMYALARQRTRETGILHHVDHIYPLRGRTVCGLHVADNLQILTSTENLKKSNKVPTHLAA